MTLITDTMNSMSPTSVRMRDVGLLLLRVFAGLALALAHGWGKLPPSERFMAGVAEMGFPFAPVFAWAAGLSETVGGLLIALGLLTRPAAALVLVTMVVAAFVRQAGDPFLERELALLYGFVAMQFLLSGPGRLSLDALVRRRRAEQAVAPALLVALGAVLLLGVIGGCGGERAEARAEGPWRVAYVAPPGAVGALRGAQLGAEEVLRAGELVGRPLAVLTATATTPAETTAAARALIRQGAFAVIGGFDEASCRALDELATEEGVLFLNVGCRGEQLRSERGPNTFHVEASESVYRRFRGASEAPEPTLWHAGLTRYGAGQLNDRFERRFGQPPGADEWASWMAIKLLWEATLRAEGTDARGLTNFLIGPAARFDGHKGQPLTFEDHQLQQPLFVPVSEPDAPDGQEFGGAPGAGATLSLPLEGPLVLVSNEGSGDVAVVDGSSNRLLARIPVGSRPRGIHVSPDGRTAFVALSDDAPTQESDRDAIAVIDLRSGQVLRRFAGGTDPEQFAVSPDGGRLYVSNEDAGLASVTELQTGEVIAQHQVGIEPEGVAVSPDGRWVYVTAETSNTVSVIDTRRNEVVASFLVDIRPRAAAFSPDGETAYVTNEIGGTVSVVDAASHRVTDVIALEADLAKPVGVVVSPDSRWVYVANGHGHSVSVIDAGAKRVAAVVPVGRRPWGVALSADGSLLYTANGGSDDLSIVDTRSLEVIGTVEVGGRPWGVAIRP